MPSEIAATWRGAMAAILLLFSTSTLAADFRLPLDPDVIILSYTEIPDLLSNPDATPRLRVYADGRALVYYPVYMKRAGYYQVRLTPGELTRMLNGVAGAIGFDARLAAEARTAEKAARRAATGIVTHRSDEVLERFDIQLDGYQPAASSPMRPVNERTEWRDIRPSAAEFPGMPGIQGLLRARMAVDDILEHPGLQRLDGAPAGPGVAQGGGS